jgi:hypothetical protein
MSVQTKMLRGTLTAVVCLLWLGCFTTCCWAKKNYDVPHDHRGVLSPYEAGPFSSLSLDDNDEKELTDGKPVMKQNRKDGEMAGGAICIQDVDAPKEAVWAQILDLDAYKGKVPKVNECMNYQVAENPDGTCTMKTKMVVGVIPGYAVRCDRSVVSTTTHKPTIFPTVGHLVYIDVTSLFGLNRSLLKMSFLQTLNSTRHSMITSMTQRRTV